MNECIILFLQWSAKRKRDTHPTAHRTIFLALTTIPTSNSFPGQKNLIRSSKKQKKNGNLGVSRWGYESPERPGVNGIYLFGLVLRVKECGIDLFGGRLLTYFQYGFTICIGTCNCIYRQFILTIEQVLFSFPTDFHCVSLIGHYSGPVSAKSEPVLPNCHSGT